MASNKRRGPDEITADIIHGYFRDAAEAKSRRETTLEDAYRRTDPSYVPDSVAHPKVKSPYLYSVLNTKLAWLIRAIKANGLWVRAETAPEYGEAGHVVTQAINAQFENRPLQNERTLLSGLGQGFKYGDHWWLLRWFDNGLHWGVRFINLHVNDVFPDPWENRFVILRRYLTLKELADEAAVLSAPVMVEAPDPETGEMTLQPQLDRNGKPVMRDGGVAYRALKKVEEAVSEGKISGRYGWNWTVHKNTWPAGYDRVSGSDDFAGSQEVSPEDDPANVRITMLEFHETDDDGLVAKIIPDNPHEAGGEDLMFQKAVEQPYGRCQLFRWSPYPVDDECYGYSLSEIVGFLADLHDFSLRASARRVQRFADPAILHRRHAKIKPICLRSQSNIAIDVEQMEDVKYMDPPAGGDMHHLMFMLTKQTMDMGVGESDQRRGQVAGAPSATEAAIAEQAGSAQDYLVASRAFMVIEDMGDMILRILRKHVTEEKLVPSLGDRTAALIRLQPEILDHHYWIRIGGTPLGGNPHARLTNLRSIFQSTANTGAWDIPSVIEFMLRETGYVNTDQFLVVKKGPPPVEPSLEHKMLEAKQNLRVSPRDDHQRHIMEHVALVLNAQRGLSGLPVDDLRLLMEHIAQHQAAWMMQQQQAQMPMGQGTGPAPFLPSQAGQPGQPATFTQRTANVNQERQAPNNGGAPQPATAPGRVGILTGSRQR